MSTGARAPSHDVELEHRSFSVTDNDNTDNSQNAISSTPPLNETGGGTTQPGYGSVDLLPSAPPPAYEEVMAPSYEDVIANQDKYQQKP